MSERANVDYLLDRPKVLRLLLRLLVRWTWCALRGHRMAVRFVALNRAFDQSVCLRCGRIRWDFQPRTLSRGGRR
jgi:hypothetical protein